MQSTKKVKSKILILSIILLKTAFLSGQGSSLNDSISGYFQEIKINTDNYKDLWDLDLYGPILLVNPLTRQVYSNYPDTAQFLKPGGNIYTGVLPLMTNIANTAITWNGKNWAMIMFPLPENKQERLDLLSHELFHRSQSALGFEMKNPENNQLDVKDGRIWLRLELEALRKAVLAKNMNETIVHLTNALIFRKYRYNLFPGASSNENLLELNEGMAAYTGNMMSGRNESELVIFFDNRLTEFQKWPTYVRSFAYVTTPIYGFLLSRTDKYWNKKIRKDTNLTDFFIEAFKLPLPKDFISVSTLSKKYSVEEITSEETARDQIIKQRIAAIKTKFIDLPHLEIYFEKMSISFDPRNIIPLEDKGSVYPTLRVSDNWGILTVTDGALIESNWSKVTVSSPTSINADKASGNGWTLDINKGYILEKNTATGNFILKKR
jgi:hypothetical protein